MAKIPGQSDQAGASAADIPAPTDATGVAACAANAPVIEATRNWLERAVIGLNLCPFAKAVHHRRQIRYIVSRATDREALDVDLAAALLHLNATPTTQVETTLLIHPLVLTDFFDYNAYLATADRIVERLGMTGVIQVASFHPQYAFADCAADAPDNNTNRSPYPMLHLLREASITKAITAFPDADDIYLRNIETMRALGTAGWQALGVGADITQQHPVTKHSSES